MLFCLTACLGEGDLLITKLGRPGNDTNRINESAIGHANWLGNGIREPATTPKPVFSVLSSTGRQTLAINEDGELYTWGSNEYEQEGGGTNTSKNRPVKICITTTNCPTNWVKVSAGYSHSLAINADGELYAWGANGRGQLGLGLGKNVHKNRPTRIGTATNWSQVAAGYDHSLAINEAGELYAWGGNYYGQLGNGRSGWHPSSSYLFTRRNYNRNSPVRIGATTNWVKVAAGYEHSLAINEDGELYAWGWNLYGQLGDGTSGPYANKNSPTRIGTATNWSQVAAGNQHSLAINEDGELYAWGWNLYGQLGDGTSGPYANKNSPTRIGTATNWSQVVAGYYHSLAINEDGELYTWGSNEYEQEGGGCSSAPYTNKTTPTRIGTATNWSQLVAGDCHSLAINEAGELYAWGWNRYGQLGDGAPYAVKPFRVAVKTQANRER